MESIIEVTVSGSLASLFEMSDSGFLTTICSFLVMDWPDDIDYDFLLQVIDEVDSAN